MSILLYRFTSWTLTKRLEKKLDGNNCRAVHRSLSSGASVYECTMGFYLVPFFSAKPAYAISSHNYYWNVSLPSGASIWNSMYRMILFVSLIMLFQNILKCTNLPHLERAAADIGLQRRVWQKKWDKVKSHGTLIDWCTGREWPVNCKTVISTWWRSNMPFQRLSGRLNYYITRCIQGARELEIRGVRDKRW